MKDRLYYQDSYQDTFTAAIVKRGTEPDGTHYVVLDQTAFYPTGGGQPCDRGVLDGIAVIDVEETDGEVRHRLAEPIPEERTQVQGKIDWQRRFDHMQQHAGQHILSAAFLKTAAAETVAFHLGTERVTIDVRLDELTPSLCEQVETLANQIILENRPITAQFVDEEELGRYPLKKQPTVTENIRIVIIPEFDYNPCGGTHPARTGEVGLIKILGWERHRGNIRVEFLCGWRAFREYTKKQATLREAARLLGTGESDVTGQIERLLAERDALASSLAEKERLLLEEEVRQELGRAASLGSFRLILKVCDGKSIQQLQQFAQQVNTQSADAITLLATAGEKLQLVFSRGAEVPVAINQVLKETLPLIEGKGGGNPAMAQGGGTLLLSPEEVLQHARQRVEEALQASGDNR